jgi:hypothetical protein
METTEQTESTESDTGRSDASTTVRWLAAVLSATVGAVHFGYAPHHLSEDWAHGWFFLLLGAYELTFAVLIVTRPRRWLWASALVVGVGSVAVWVVSRTVGLPFGPEALRTEEASAPDIVCTVISAAVVLLAFVSLVAPRRLQRPVRDRVSLRFTAGAFATVAVIAGALVLTPDYTEAHAASGHAHDGGADVLTGDTPCELAGEAVSPAQVMVDAEGHDHRGPTPQLPLTRAERIELEAQQTLARTVVTRYPTVAAAEAAGYKKSTVYIPCIGAHYTNFRYVMKFDPANPSELLFDGTDPDSRLVGLSYLLVSFNGPPAGFAGPNDVWHQHNANGGLCLKGGLVIGAESMSEETCRSLGGRKNGGDFVWMVHNWIVPGWECSWGVFAADCPELGGRIGGTAWDAPVGTTDTLAPTS